MGKGIKWQNKIIYSYMCTYRTEVDHLVRLTQALNENNIPYETRLKKATFINNLFFLIFYHTFASGIDHKNETTCIYVLEKDFDAAKKAIVNYRETVRKSL